MPRAVIAPGEHYHIFNRGVNKQRICLDDSDRIRLLFYFLHFQSLLSIPNTHSATQDFKQKKKFSLAKRTKEYIADQRQVELEAFCIMPNHFHLMVYEVVAGGISKYLMRVQNAYTKYFNKRYDRSGYLFQGPFQSVHQKGQSQYEYLSAYIHSNPNELREWKGKIQEYPWSSYQDYYVNRWGSLLSTDTILGQFSDYKGYRSYVTSVKAKHNYPTSEVG